MIDLRGKVCLVTGASRGIGKGIAVQLAFYGATCYVTGRNAHTLEVLTREVEEIGGVGKCIPVECDHGDDEKVKEVFERIDRENNGKLDLLVNNAYTAVQFIFEHMEKKFWEQPPEAWDVINKVGLRNHYLCAIHASKMMIEKRQGLIINVSSSGGLRYLFSTPYGIGKAANDRMANDCAHELKKFKVAFISLWPGLVRTEKLKELTEVSKKPDEDKHPKFISSGIDEAETPTFVGRTVAALLSEPHAEVMQKSGKIILTTDIGRAHGISDENGLVPPPMFQLNRIMKMVGYTTMAKFIPDFVRIPTWILFVGEAFKRC